MTDRLRYGESHWSREVDVKKAFEQYLHLGERVFNKKKIVLFNTLTKDVEGKTILDYGGGAGIMAIPFARNGANVVIVDAEQNALRTATFYASRLKVGDRIKTIHSEAFPIGLRNEQFDIIIAKDIIEHIEYDQEFLIDLSECQNIGGVLLLSTQNSFSLNYLVEGGYQKYWCKNSNWFGWDETHLRFYTSSILKDKLGKAGYKAQSCYGMYIIPYDILSWLFFYKFKVSLPVLHFFDLLFGKVFPFNRLGWNIIVRAERVK